MTIDFVVHGSEGLAGPWAAAVQPGETVRFLGPGGSYTPDPAADWHLLVGDESALPAIAASVERAPEGARMVVLLEVEGPDEELKIAAPPGADIVWLHAGSARSARRWSRPCGRWSSHPVTCTPSCTARPGS